jgi:hypothetical protein
MVKATSEVNAVTSLHSGYNEPITSRVLERVKYQLLKSGIADRFNLVKIKEVNLRERFSYVRMMVDRIFK